MICFITQLLFLLLQLELEIEKIEKPFRQNLECYFHEIDILSSFRNARLVLREWTSTMGRPWPSRRSTSCPTCGHKKSRCANSKSFKKLSTRILSNFWPLRKSKRAEERSLSWSCVLVRRILIIPMFPLSFHWKESIVDDLLSDDCASWLFILKHNFYQQG